MRGVSDPVAIPLLGVLCVSQLAIWFASSGPLAYGYMSDEMYYLDCAERLAWGYVDHPPLSPFVLAGVRALLGESLLALHLLPALALWLDVALVALLARELGGGRVAQTIAALAVFAAPVHQGVASFYSMNAFEPALWSGAFLLLAKLANGGRPRLWLALGALLGVGLLNKLSVLWLGAGLAVGMLATPARRQLATPWPWTCAGVAALFLAPHVAWQLANDWPTLEFMRNATAEKMVAKTPLAFAGEQVLVMGPLAAPLWLAGLGWYFLTPAGRRQQWLAWIWIVVLGLLVASGTARANYAAPAYGALLAAGGVAVEGFARSGPRRALPAALAAGLLVSGLASLPLATPLLPPERLSAYARALGVEVPREQVGEDGPLPLHFALRFGWHALIDAVAQAQAALAPGERERAVVLAPSFGAAAALRFLARERGLPPVISGHNNYFLWGHGGAIGDVLIAVSEDPGQLERAYRSVERVAEIDCEYCAAEVDRWSVFVCRGLRVPFERFWRGVRHFI
jgi:4-amino-4-deoxy-L-arabinose transferase-like glycosyltransferase